MGLFDFLKPKPKEFFNEAEKQRIVEAVREAEQRTSGEVRVFLEPKCRFVDAIDRAAEVFFLLKMEKTELRNGTLIYVATEDKQIAVFGDEGIHQKVSNEFWKEQVKKMLSYFNNNNISEGVINVIRAIGDALYQHFPYDNKTDKNELPDDIVFGK